MELDRRVAVVVPAETFWIGGVRGEREKEKCGNGKRMREKVKRSRSGAGIV